MKKRANKTTRYLRLWSNSSDSKQLKLVRDNEESFYKKAIDSLCLKVDMCETVEEYVHEFCEGMQQLIELGVPRNGFLKHKLIFSKILSLGSDIVETSNKKHDLFYIGLFIDAKISSHWYKRSFYKMIISMLKLILGKSCSLPELIKNKIITLVKHENFTLYALHFNHNALKSTA